MANATTKNKNSKNGKNKSNFFAQNKKLILIVMSVVIAVSILAAVVFGFKLYAFGKEVKITYKTRGGNLANETQIVRVCNDYSLYTPTHPQEKTFEYWSLDVKGKEKVEPSGIWLLSTDDIVLYANWGDDGWTDNY